MSDMRSVFITGSSSGFGLDTAVALADRGHTVFATMRGVDGKNSEIAGQLKTRAQENGWDLHVLELDVTDDASVEAAVGFAISQTGKLDVIILGGDLDECQTRFEREVCALL